MGNTIDNDGGGLYIRFDNDTYNTIIIANSIFKSNIIVHNGGGLYAYSNTSVYNIITITDSSKFNNNTILSDKGGGLYIFSDTDIFNYITIIKSVFTNNNIVNNDGGGVFIYSGNNTYNVTIINCTFTGNTAINGGGLLLYSDADKQNFNITIANSNFTNNNGSGMITFKSYKIVLSQIIVSNNNGSGMLAIGQCTVVFTEGHSVVANNSSPTDGGGIFLGTQSYLTTSNGGHVSFINNTALRYGGAIYSLDEDYTLLTYNMDMPLFLSDSCTVYNLSATFTNNNAVRAGDQLYGGAFVFCNDCFGPVHPLDSIQDMIECTNVPASITNTTSVHPLSSVSSNPLAVCPCVNGIVNCSITSLNRQAYPGQILNVSLVTVGLCGGVSPGSIAVEHDRKIKLLSSTIDNTSTSCTILNYIVRLTTYISNTTVTFNIADSDAYDIRPVDVRLSILPCPLGLVLDSLSGECVCSDHIQISQVLCSITWMPYPIQRSGNNWISSQYNKYNCTIAHIGCPFDYCNTSSVKFSLSESDL